MFKFILRRLVSLPVLIFLVTSLLFLFMLQIPLEQRIQAYIYTGKPNKTLEEEQRLIQEITERYGLNDPFPVQYVRWLENLGRGDWGFSETARMPVLESLLRRVPATIELSLFALIPSIILALFLGESASRHPNSLADYTIRAFASIGWSFPFFILGLILMKILYAWLHWFPPERLSGWATSLIASGEFRIITGMYTIDALLNLNLPVFWDALQHMVLPGLTLAIAQTALLTRVMRNSMMEVWRENYITTAKAKGVSQNKLSHLHARRNAVLPMISTVGTTIPAWLSSLVIIEVIFHFDGIGYWTVKAVQNQEIPTIVGFVIFSCAITVLASLATDILYAILDPRTRTQP